MERNIQRSPAVKAFEEEDFSLSRLGRSFVYSLYPWASLVIVSDPFVVRKLVPLAGS